MKLEELITTAILKVLTAKKLPVVFLRWEKKDPMTYKLWFEDTKLEAWRTKTSYPVSCSFSTLITEEFVSNHNTTGIDLMAKVPADADQETRALLRIAFCIYNVYRQNIYDSYKVVCPVDKILNWNNAIAWYKEEVYDGK